MSIGLLSDHHVAALRSKRAKAWTRTFTVKTEPEAYADDTDAFSAKVGSSVSAALLGDWAWRDQNVMKGTPGGQMNTADVILNTDILYSGSFVQGVTRMVLDGLECSVDKVTPFPDTRELVVAGTKVSP